MNNIKVICYKNLIIIKQRICSAYLIYLLKIVAYNLLHALNELMTLSELHGGVPKLFKQGVLSVNTNRVPTQLYSVYPKMQLGSRFEIVEANEIDVI